MKPKRLFFLFTLIFFFFLLPGVVLAKLETPQETKNIEVKKGEVIDHDFFAAGESVTISGVVNGDVYAAGANITVDGKINGDLLGGAGIVTLLGEVTDDVRIGGGNILINGVIGKNLTVGGGSVTITDEARIMGSLLAFAGSVDVRGPIGREANVFAGRALFANKVGGDLKGAFEELILTSEAQISGDLEYESEKEADIDEDALVVGETTRKVPEKKEAQLEKFAPELRPVIFGFTRIKLYLKFFSFIVSLIFGLIFLSLFPKRAKGIVEVLESRLWASLGVGILTPILFGLAMILLAITLVGIPLILIIAPLFGLLVYFSKIFTALFLGRKILLNFNWSKSQSWALFAGLLIYYLLRLIPVPVIGGLTGFVFTTTGLGAFVLDQKSLRQKSKK